MCTLASVCIYLSACPCTSACVRERVYGFVKHSTIPSGHVYKLKSSVKVLQSQRWAGQRREERLREGESGGKVRGGGGGGWGRGVYVELKV